MRLTDTRGFVQSRVGARIGGCSSARPVVDAGAGKSVLEYQFETAGRARRDEVGAGAPRGNAATAAPDAKPPPQAAICASAISPKTSRKEPVKETAQRTGNAVRREPTRLRWLRATGDDAADAPKPAAHSPTSSRKPFRAEALARMQRAVLADCGLHERLVVVLVPIMSASSNRRVRGCGPASSNVRTIRPHVLGRFADMLKASSTSGDAVFSTTSNRSVRTTRGDQRNRGLNESRAREIMEMPTSAERRLHQDRVTARARIHHRWTLPDGRRNWARPALCVNANAHSPARSG